MSYPAEVVASSVPPAASASAPAAEGPSSSVSNNVNSLELEGVPASDQSQTGAGGEEAMMANHGSLPGSMEEEEVIPPPQQAAPHQTSSSSEASRQSAVPAFKLPPLRNYSVQPMEVSSSGAPPIDGGGNPANGAVNSNNSISTVASTTIPPANNNSSSSNNNINGTSPNEANNTQDQVLLGIFFRSFPHSPATSTAVP